MPSLASFADPKVYHILSYSTLLGSTFFQSFITGPVAFSCLPRPSFATLQTKLTPPFFWLQTVLPLVMAVTWPGEKLAGTAGAAALRKNSGGRGLLAHSNIWTASVPVLVMFSTAALNALLLGPATTKVMRERKHQETRDGKKYYDPGPHSDEMQRLNSSFNWIHSLSASSTMVGFVASVVYGAMLAERL